MLISGYHFINGNIIRTQAIFRIQVMASLADKVYLNESAVQGHHICKRV